MYRLFLSSSRRRIIAIDENVNSSGNQKTIFSDFCDTELMGKAYDEDRTTLDFNIGDRNKRTSEKIHFK